MLRLRHFTTLVDVGRRPIWKLKQTYYHRLWSALTGHKWHEFERLLGEMKYKGLNLDEVTYTLKAHYFILNPHKPSLSCYLVIEEMKKALVHPAVIRMNENLINSYFELEEFKCQPPSALWQNFTKIIWRTSLRLNRQRMQKLKSSLQAMDSADIMRLTDEDAATVAEEEFMHAMLSSTLAIDEIYDEPITVYKESSASQEESTHANLAELERVTSVGLAEAYHEITEQDETLAEDNIAYEEEENDIELEYVYQKQDAVEESATTASS